MRSGVPPRLVVRSNVRNAAAARSLGAIGLTMNVAPIASASSRKTVSASLDSTSAAVSGRRAYARRTFGESLLGAVERVGQGDVEVMCREQRYGRQCIGQRPIHDKRGQGRSNTPRIVLRAAVIFYGARRHHARTLKRCRHALRSNRARSSIFRRPFICLSANYISEFLTRRESRTAFTTV